MVTPAIPERIYALCKIVEKMPISLADLKDKMEPEYLHQTTSYFSDYRGAAEELRLISISDNIVSLAVKPSIVKTTASMRQYVNSILEEFRLGQFYQVTQAYFNLDASVLTGEKNVSTLASMISQKINRPVDAVAMRAWRFWVSYLGLGYMQNMFMIPNSNVFLKDVIDNAGFEKNRRYSFGEFISKILPYAKMVIDPHPSNRQINYGVSNGLRSLNDAGIIKLEHIMDQEDIWSLYPLKAHAIRGIVTNITICK